MNNDRKLLEQALNLLESEWPEGDEIAQPVIDAIREALAEPDMKECRHCGFLCKPNPDESKKWYPLKEPVNQEPVAWGLTDETGEVLDCISNNYKTTQPCTVDYDLPLYAAPVDAKAIRAEAYAAALSASDYGEGWEEGFKAGRAEALEEAAKVCDGWPDYDVDGLAEVIRGIK